MTLVCLVIFRDCCYCFPILPIWYLQQWRCLFILFLSDLSFYFAWWTTHYYPIRFFRIIPHQCNRYWQFMATYLLFFFAANHNHQVIVTQYIEWWAVFRFLFSSFHASLLWTMVILLLFAAFIVAVYWILCILVVGSFQGTDYLYHRYSSYYRYKLAAFLWVFFLCFNQTRISFFHHLSQKREH